MNYAVEFPVPEESVDSWDIYVIANVHFSDSVWDLTPLFHNKRQGLDSLHRLNFKTIDIFGAKLGAFSRNDELTTENFEMLVIAEKKKMLTNRST